MQVIECKPAFVPDALFVSGKNPNREATMMKSPQSDDTSTTTDVPFPSTHSTRTPPRDSIVASDPPAAIPGLETRPTYASRL